MGYAVFYAFMLVVATVCLGGYGFLKFLNDYYKKEFGE